MRRTKPAIQSLFLCGAVLLGAALLVSPVSAETSLEQGIKVAVSGKLRPTVLPRRGTVPVKVSLGGKISSTQSDALPKLTKLTIEINRKGRLDSHGLPRCRLGQIRPSTDRQALDACGPALVGEGSFSADVRIPEQSPFPSHGKVLAFNGRLHGAPALLAHIYGTEPYPTSYVLPFRISRRTGTYGTVLEVAFPQVTGEWGFVTGLTMSLHRRFVYRDKTRGYLSAGCPAPKGFTEVLFPLARTSFEFDNGVKIDTVLNRTCTVRR
jgi:hypothetical protein